MDSLIPWSILSVLLQRLPVHRGTANPTPPAQLLPWPCPQCPQHSLDFKPPGKNQTHQADKRWGRSQSCFPMEGTEIPQSLEGRLGSHFRDDPRRCKDVLRAPVGVPTLCSFSHPATLESFPCLPKEFFPSWDSRLCV